MNNLLMHTTIGYAADIKVIPDYAYLGGKNQIHKGVYIGVADTTNHVVYTSVILSKAQFAEIVQYVMEHS